MLIIIVAGHEECEDGEEEDGTGFRVQGLGLRVERVEGVKS